MSIPLDWLLEEVSSLEVEERLTWDAVPDYWLDSWSVLLGRMAPGDELWFYAEPTRPPLDDEITEQLDGFEQVHDGETLQRLGFSVLPDCLLGFTYRYGYALVRDDEVLDWLDIPF
jgi:hypothetical protein